MGGRLETDVANGRGDDATYFHHVGGTFYTADLYGMKAQHRRGDAIVRDECIARLTLLWLETEYDQLTVKAGPLERPITPDDCILIANFERPGHDHDPDLNPHVRKYSKLLDFGNASLTMRTLRCDAAETFEPPVAPCEWVLRVIRSPRFETSIHPECGNTNWP
jgi:hypothetical protein